MSATSPAVKSIQRHARAALTESMSIDERMSVYRTMIDALMGEYTALRNQRDQMRVEAQAASQDARAIAREEKMR